MINNQQLVKYLERQFSSIVTEFEFYNDLQNINQLQQISFMPNSLLQKSFQNLLCQQEGHEQEPLTYICITPQCEHNSVMCYLCSLEKHQDHQKIGLKVFLKQLQSLETKSEKAIPLCAQIDQVFNFIKGRLIAHTKKFTNPDLVISTFQKYRILNVQYAMNFYSLITKLSESLEETQERQKVQKLNEFIKNSYFKYFGEMESDEWTKTNICQALLSKKITALNDINQLLLKLEATHKINQTNVLNLFPLQEDQIRKIKVHFSEDMKPNNMTLITPYHAKMQTSASQRLLILEPCLSKTMTVKKWGVKVIKLASWIGIGVCHINEIKKAKYMFQYSNTGHGNYMISSNGYSWSSYKKQYNSKFQPFSFTTGDVIHVEYNPRERMLKLKKESDPNQPTYELQIEANDDPIHPEINLTGINDQVQIINF